MYFILLTNMRLLRLVVTPQLRKTSDWSFFASLKISYSEKQDFASNLTNDLYTSEMYLHDLIPALLKILLFFGRELNPLKFFIIRKLTVR